MVGAGEEVSGNDGLARGFEVLHVPSDEHCVGHRLGGVQSIRRSDGLDEIRSGSTAVEGTLDAVIQSGRNVLLVFLSELREHT